MVVWKLYMVQNVWYYSNVPPDHVNLPFEYWAPILSGIQLISIQMVTVFAGFTVQLLRIGCFWKTLKSCTWGLSIPSSQQLFKNISQSYNPCHSKSKLKFCHCSRLILNLPKNEKKIAKAPKTFWFNVSG